MNTGNSDIVWASSRFGKRRPEYDGRNMNVFSIIWTLFRARLLINKMRLVEARRILNKANNAIDAENNQILRSVSAELQAEIEVCDGDIEAAITLYEEYVMPGYEGMTRVITSRASESLKSLKEQKSDSANG